MQASKQAGRQGKGAWQTGVGLNEQVSILLVLHAASLFLESDSSMGFVTSPLINNISLIDEGLARFAQQTAQPPDRRID